MMKRHRYVSGTESLSICLFGVVQGKCISVSGLRAGTITIGVDCVEPVRLTASGRLNAVIPLFGKYFFLLLLSDESIVQNLLRLKIVFER